MDHGYVMKAIPSSVGLTEEQADKFDLTQPLRCQAVWRPMLGAAQRLASVEPAGYC